MVRERGVALLVGMNVYDYAQYLRRKNYYTSTVFF